MSNMVVVAKECHLQILHDWLSLEENAYKKQNYDDDSLTRGFFCNWSMIKKAFDESTLYVFLSEEDVVGFVVLGTTGPDLLEIHPNYRRCGYGRKMVNWLIDYYFHQDYCFLEIECAPKDSIPFWEKMGFTVISTNEIQTRYCGFFLLHRILHTPQGNDALVEMEFYSIGNYPRGHKQCCKGVYNTTFDTLYLSNRMIAVHSDNLSADSTQLCVDIFINGHLRFKGLLSTKNARIIGFKKDKGYHMYIDKAQNLLKFPIMM